MDEYEKLPILDEAQPGCGCCALALVVVGALFAWSLYAEVRIEAVPFDAERWCAVDERSDWGNRERQQMLEGLLARLQSSSPSIDGVRELLGAPYNVYEGPLEVPTWSSITGTHEGMRVLQYRLGPGRYALFDLDSEWLQLAFDGQGPCVGHRAFRS